MSNLKKILLGAVVIIAFGAYVLTRSPQSQPVAVNTEPTPDNTNTQPSPFGGGTSVPSETTNPSAGGTNPTPTPSPAPASGYKDGTYTSKVADAFYGNIQVKVTIKGGKITDIAYLQFPNDKPRTIEISNDALPKLKAEAIAAQSAKVDIVSGATQTSEGFETAMADALAQAS